MKFPITVNRGSVSLKIYRTRHKKMKAGHLYQVAWHGPEGRKLRQFAKLSEAKDFAHRTAEHIQAGRSEATDLNRNDVDLLAEIRRICPTISPVQALLEWKQAREKCRGNLMEAADLWHRHHPGDMESIPLSQAVAEFLQAKQRMGIDIKSAYKNRLELFASHFQGIAITEIRTPDINRYLTRFQHPGTRNTHRKNLVTFFSWSRKQGFLPQNMSTAAENSDRAKDQQGQVEVFSPEEFQQILKLIDNHHPHYLPALLLAGFCGLRRNEVHGQHWEDIDLEKGFLHVTEAKPRTPQDRYVPIAQNALDWFQRFHGPRNGKVCDNLAMDRIRSLCRKAGINPPENAFRHSFISYAIAKGTAIGLVAQWAGNTERIIHQHYRKPRPQEEGKKWFDISPL